MQPILPSQPRLARDLALLALSLLWSLPVRSVAETTDQPAAAGDEPLYAAPTRPDRVGRMLAAVEVNGSGPYRFIIDLGANRSVLSSRLAAVLGLASAGTGTVEVHGVTGSAVVPMAVVDELRVGSIVLVDQQMPVLTGAVFADADGILGIDGLQQSRIEVDFRHDRVKIGSSDPRGAPHGYLTVPARMINEGLLLVAGRVGNVKTHVIIDTGAEYTIGNLPLRQALLGGARKGDRQGSVVTGATPGTASGVTHATPSITIGEARLRNIPVTFSDLYIFSLWGLADEPTLIVGMDVLGTVQKFVVDYGRREFQIKAYPQTGAEVDRCRSGNCGTRLKGSPN
ncbi:MAG: aspartyl protease family protein [Rubrivivax sp.]|nr:aspartyl protease family protein [Rubrivivax sp.]